MSTQPEALRHAEWLELSLAIGAQEAAAELRRLHEFEVGYGLMMTAAEARIAALEAEAASLRDQNSELDRRLAEMEQAGRQALEALESSRVFVTTREKIKHPEGTEWYDERITALRQALGDKHD